MNARVENKILNAAMKKAVELNVFPEYAPMSDYVNNYQNLGAVLDVAFAAQAATIAQLRAELAKVLVTIFIDGKQITNTQADAIAEKYWNTWEEVQTAARALKGGE